MRERGEGFRVIASWRKIEKPHDKGSKGGPRKKKGNGFCSFLIPGKRKGMSMEKREVEDLSWGSQKPLGGRGGEKWYPGRRKSRELRVWKPLVWGRRGTRKVEKGFRS